MKVLLVSANHWQAPYPVYPLGLDYVAGALEPDHRVRVADINALGGAAELAAAAADFGPDLVGLSLRNIDSTDASDPRGLLDECRQLAAELRRVSDAPLVVGGSGFTIFPEVLMELLGADFGIAGEGERLAGLAAALERGRDPGGLPGVVVPGRPCTLPPPLAAEPRRRIAPEGAALDFYLRRGGMLNLQTKRGCPFRCIYCTYPRIEGRCLRPFAPATVAREARELQERGARFLFVTDSAFNADPHHSLEVAAAMAREGLTIPWGAFFAPTAPPPGYYRQLARAGLTHVEFGSEALADPVLAAYGKPFRVEDVRAAHAAALESGLQVAHYLLLGGPGETAATLAETLSNIDKLERTVVFFFCGMRVYPHTALVAQASASGQIPRSGNLLDPVFFRPPDLAPADIIRRVEAVAAGRVNWVIGGGGDHMARILGRLHARGHSGPLWELLIR
jgi:radical SAM superfamily enzyme YgiQ (UPF0313 family)